MSAKPATSRRAVPRAARTTSGGMRPAIEVPVAPRGRGRPARGAQSALSRESIIEKALEMARRIPLQDLSIVRVAQELDVTPGLIHYYLGARDALTSGVMNAFYKELVARWPAATGHWRRDLEAVCAVVYETHASYRGVASYVVSHNKYRMVQDVRAGETDYGVLVFEKFNSAVRAAGFDGPQTGMYTHLLNEFVTAYAQATATYRWAGEHSDFLVRKIAELNPREYPTSHFVSKGLAKLDAPTAFKIGLELVLVGLERARKQARAASRKPKR